jgi:AcrR family transcriptional regulator
VSVLRADARRNLDRILDAAEEVFAELGPDAPIDEIARRAGVGHGTVFRHFPTKQALRAALLDARLEEMVDLVAGLSQRDDAGAAFDEFFMTAAHRFRRDRAFFEGVEECSACFPEIARRKDELKAAVDRLIRRARKEGHVRRDVDARDVVALLSGALDASQHSERPDAWKRYVRVVLDGLHS